MKMYLNLNEEEEKQLRECIEHIVFNQVCSPSSYPDLADRRGGHMEAERKADAIVKLLKTGNEEHLKNAILANEEVEKNSRKLHNSLTQLQKILG